MSNSAPTSPQPSSASEFKLPKRKGYLWGGLLNPSVFISDILEIGFMVVLSLIEFPPVKP